MVSESAAELSARADRAMRFSDMNTAISSLETYVLLAPNDHDHWLKLAAVRRGIGDLAGALDASVAAVRSQPRSFLAMLMTAGLLDAMRRQEEATHLYQAALDVAPQETQLPDAVRRQLDRGRAICTASLAWRQTVASLDMTEAKHPAERDRLINFRNRILGGDEREPISLFYPGLRHRSFHEVDQFPGMAQLEHAASPIREEFETVAALRGRSGANHVGVPDAGEGPRPWSVISLWRDGEIVHENASLCPVTMRLYEALRPPLIPGRSPNLMFSILDGHSRIPPHRGITNTRLVMHLPLVLPERCGIRVADETRRWSQGHALLFDDTFEHEVWNDSDEQRVILLGDLWHPDLSDAERIVIAKLMARIGPEAA